VREQKSGVHGERERRISMEVGRQVSGGIPQDMAAAVVDSLRDETHKANAASAVHQVDVPGHLRQEQ